MTLDRRPLGPLPRIPRPTHRESLDGYLRRLAAANHLPPSYLYAHLAIPGTGYPGRIDPDRLAAATGRATQAITRTFPTLLPASRTHTQGRTIENRTATTRNKLARAQTYAAIRQDRAAGASLRALAARYHVNRRTVRQALESPNPPERKRPTRNAPNLDPIRDRLDALLNDNNLTIREIWQRLFDEADKPVSYSMVAEYARTRRPATRRPAEQARAPQLSGTPMQHTARDLFHLVRTRPGMYGVHDFTSACAFVTGYDAATGFIALAGFREMLITRLASGGNLTWHALVNRLAFGEYRAELDQQANETAIETLFTQLDQFLALRDQYGGLTRIYDDYLTWLKSQPWFDTFKHFKIPPVTPTQPTDDTAN